jgi:hypothetical protein
MGIEQNKSKGEFVALGMVPRLLAQEGGLLW